MLGNMLKNEISRFAIFGLLDISKPRIQRDQISENLFGYPRIIKKVQIRLVLFYCCYWEREAFGKIKILQSDVCIVGIFRGPLDQRTLVSIWPTNLAMAI